MSVLRFLRDTAMDLCLGCRHSRLTRLFTIEEQSYMVCLDCGRQIFYSTKTMQRLSPREHRRLHAAHTAYAGSMHAKTAPGAGLRLVPKAGSADRAA